jgi:hypothetical protein
MDAGGLTEGRFVRPPSLGKGRGCNHRPLNSVLAVSQRGAVALRNDVGLERAQARIVGVERLAFDRVFDASVDHVAQPRNALPLGLVFRVGLWMGLDRVRVADVAAYPIVPLSLSGLWNISLPSSMNFAVSMPAICSGGVSLSYTPPREPARRCANPLSVQF